MPGVKVASTVLKRSWSMVTYSFDLTRPERGHCYNRFNSRRETEKMLVRK